MKDQNHWKEESRIEAYLCSSSFFFLQLILVTSLLLPVEWEKKIATFLLAPTFLEHALEGDQAMFFTLFSTPSNNEKREMRKMFFLYLGVQERQLQHKTLTLERKGSG